MTTERRLRLALRELSAMLDKLAHGLEARGTALPHHNVIGHVGALQSIARYAARQAAQGTRRKRRR